MSPACSHRVMMGSIESHKKPIPREPSAPQRQHSLSLQSRPTGGRRAACEPARKTKPSLHLILGLAALRMFWAIFIFGFSNSSTLKVITLKAVVLPLAPGFFPSPQEPGQRVQQCESPDLPGKPCFQGAGRTLRPAKTSQPARIGGTEKRRSFALYLITSWLHGFLNSSCPRVSQELLCLFSHQPCSVFFLFF